MSNVNIEAIKSDIRQAVLNNKANHAPTMIRLAWHASGTYDKSDKSGGSDGAGMRFAPESTDDANAGLGLMRDLLEPVKAKHPTISYADLWTLAGIVALELTGGPTVAHKLGRTDFADGSKCPANGRLPDAAQGPAHLRDVFYRQGFNDQEIVALSGAHTLGRCHTTRSGFDGPWTRNENKFDNQYFKLLLGLTWKPRKWDGPLQYEDEESGELMMLPTDMCLLEDASFRKWVEIYAKDQNRFFKDFSAVFAKLISNGAKEAPKTRLSAKDKASAAFRNHAMHSSLDHMKRLAPDCDPKQVDPASGRSALHAAAYNDAHNVINYLIKDCGLSVNQQDFNGDTPLHDAMRFGNTKVVDLLVKNGANPSIKNKAGLDAAGHAKAFGKGCPFAKL